MDFYETEAIFKSMSFSTLSISKRLEDHGVPPSQANVLAETIVETSDHNTANLVTKDYLRAGLGDVKTALKTEIAGARTELKTEIAGARAELKTEIVGVRAELKVDIARIRTELKVDIAEVRTEIANVKTELKTEIAEVRTEIVDAKTELKADIAEVKTEIANVRTEMANFGISMLKWMVGLHVGSLFGTLSLVAGLIYFLLKPFIFVLKPLLAQP